MFTENSIIKQLQSFKSSKKHPELLLGIGDDAAAICPNNTNLVFSTDSLIEDNHFSFLFSSGTQVAQKLITKNLSDIYVKNAKPMFILSNLHLNHKTLSKYPDFLPTFIKELEKQCIQHQIQLIGGDTAFSNTNTFTLTVIGKTNLFIPRKSDQVKNGDPIFLLGHTGMSKIILNELQSPNPTSLKKNLTSYYHAPKIQKNIQKILQDYNATISIDQSDSLLKSLEILAQQNNKTIHLILENIPIHPSILAILKQKKISNVLEESLKYTLYGCEDFAIIFSCSQTQKYNIQDKNLYKIGTFKENNKDEQIVSFYKEKRYSLHKFNIQEESFEHFNINGR